MPTQPDTERRKAALESVARTGGREGAAAKRILSDEAAAAARKAQADSLAALPKSLAEAKGDARAFSKANMQRQLAQELGREPSNPGRASMLAELNRQGLEPAR